MSETPPTDYASLADEIAGWLRFQMDQVGASRLVLGSERRHRLRCRLRAQHHGSWSLAGDRRHHAHSLAPGGYA